MWDETPFVDALFSTLDPSVQADTQAAREHIAKVVLLQGDRRPFFPTDAWAELERKPAGFVFDRPTGLFFIPDYADHERCAGALMVMRELRGPVHWAQAKVDGTLPDGRAADRYLSTGEGFVANSPSLRKPGSPWQLTVGAEVALTSQEKIWFRDFEINRH